MTWKPRVCGEHLYHHIYAWGNDRHPVFKDPAHYRKYLGLLKKYSVIYKIDILAYALMEWHVHQFIYDDLNNLSNFMWKLHGDYAQYFNREARRVGHVFGERFNNKVVMPNQYGLWLTRYIHRQPLEAKLVKDPRDYPWTSYRVYLGLEKSNFVKPDVIISQYGAGRDARKLYEQFVIEERDDEPVDWGKKSFTIINEDHIINLISKEVKVEPFSLIQPKGKVERSKRHEAMRLLFEKHNYSKSQIARLFKISRMAVSLILKNDVMNKK